MLSTRSPMPPASVRPVRRRRTGCTLLALALSAVLAAFAATSASAAPVPGTDVLYTSDGQFDQGTLVNVNHDAPNNDQLQLNRSTGTFRFIWVALSQRCTIAKIDTETGTILGEYRTVSDATPCAESSRTTVALDGSVWVGHRGYGRVTHVGLSESNDCVDRNANGTIETSSGYGDVKPWPGSGAGVSAAHDECILHHIDTGGGDSRHMSIDADNDLWVGDRNGGSIFHKYDGDTGALLIGPLDFACGGYGGLIDGNGVIWSATSGGSFLRYDTNLPPASAQCLPYDNYGMAIDSQGNVWVSTLGEGVVRKFSPSGLLLGAFPQGTSFAQGLAVDNDDDVWISSSLFCGGGCVVSHLRNDGSFVGNVPTPTGSGSTGVAVDAAGKVWTANLSSHTAVRIDPEAGPVVGGTPLGAVDLTVDFPAGPDGRPLPYPYNYSDMTGQQLFNSTAPQGTWTVVQDGGSPGTGWGTITWNTEPQGSVPPGTTLLVEARAADSEAGLGAQAYVAVSNGAEFSLTGRFIQVRATLKPDTDGTSPVLSDVRVEVANEPPVADAGGPYSVYRGESVELDGTGSSDPDGDPLTYAWDLDENGSFETTGATPDFSAAGLDEGDYTVTLRVCDPSGECDTDTAIVHVLNRDPSCAEARPTVAEIWPPNHKFVAVGILGVTDAEGDALTITVTGIRQDEPVNTHGDGNTAPDGKGVGTATAHVRAERSGTKKVPGDGRVYHVAFSATDGHGGSCSDTVKVSVPHDQRGDAAVDGGPLYDSTVG